MVKKIKDPRHDDSAVSMRIYRANKVYKYIVSQIRKNIVEFDQDKFTSGVYDEKFLENFKESPHSIQQELIFLWEEVGDLTKTNKGFKDDIDHLQSQLDQQAYDNKNEEEPVKKHRYIFGP